MKAEEAPAPEPEAQPADAPAEAPAAEAAAEGPADASVDAPAEAPTAEDGAAPASASPSRGGPPGHGAAPAVRDPNSDEAIAELELPVLSLDENGEPTPLPLPYVLNEETGKPMPLPGVESLFLTGAPPRGMPCACLFQHAKPLSLILRRRSAHLCAGMQQQPRCCAHCNCRSVKCFTMHTRYVVCGKGSERRPA